jgi:hypothetical protein
MPSRKPHIKLLLVTMVLAGCAITAPLAPPQAAKTMESEPRHDVWPSMTGAPENFHPAQEKQQSNRESACTSQQPGGSNSSTNCF